MYVKPKSVWLTFQINNTGIYYITLNWRTCKSTNDILFKYN